MTKSNQPQDQVVAESAGVERADLIGLPPHTDHQVSTSETSSVPQLSNAFADSNQELRSKGKRYLHQYGPGLAGAGSALRLGITWRKSITLGLVTGLLLCGIGGGVYWQVSKKGSFGRLSVAGVEVTRSKTYAEMDKQLNQKMADYRLTIEKPGTETQKYTLDQLGVSVNIAQTIDNAKAAKEQGPLLQRLQWWHNNSAPVVFSVDQEKLQQFIDEHATVVVEAPVSAALIIEEGIIRTTPQSDGKGYFDSSAHERIATSIRNLKPTQLVFEQQTLKPKITNEAVSALKNQVEAILNKP